jgi:hypothetical protein
VGGDADPFPPLLLRRQDEEEDDDEGRHEDNKGGGSGSGSGSGGTPGCVTSTGLVGLLTKKMTGWLCSVVPAEEDDASAASEHGSPQPTLSMPAPWPYSPPIPPPIILTNPSPLG